MSNTTNKLIVVLNMPASVPDFITKSKTIHKSMTANIANYQSSSNRLNDLSAQIIILETCQSGLGATPPTSTTAARDSSIDKVNVILRNLRNDVQDAADVKPESAENIILSAAMSVKKTKSNSSKQFTLEEGSQSGSVLLSAISSGPHQWQQSFDGGDNFFNIDPTLISTIEVFNLPLNQKVWFRYRTINTKGTYGDWAQWTSFISTK